MQDNPIIISVEIAKCIIKKSLVDQGSSTDILFWNTFKQMDIPKFEILPHDDPLFDFVGEEVGIKGCIWLYTKFGHEGPLQKRLNIRYVIMYAHTSYNMFLIHPSLNALCIVVLTPHLEMKFTADARTIIIVHANQRTTRENYMASLKLCPHAREEAPKVVHHVEAKTETKEVEELEINLRTNDNNRVKPVKETSTFQLEPKEG